IKPLLYKSTKHWITDSERSSSIVNLVRSQSQEAPSFFNCSRIVPPYLSVHSHACLRKTSRVRVDLSMPSAFNLATTLASLAVEASSVPGAQQALNPFNLAFLINTS